MNRLDGAYNEESLRVSLRRRLAVRHADETGTVLIDELGLCRGSARVDLAVVNGQVHAYEIKSERDDLRRLGTQAALYSKVFDRVTLVCGERHVSQALDTVPPWWAVLRIASVGRNPTFKSVRRGRKNPE